MEQLSQFVVRATRHGCEDGLVVTGAEPRVAYILSTRWSTVVKYYLQHLVRLIEDRLELEGAIFITKDSGLFEAIKSE